MLLLQPLDLTVLSAQARTSASGPLAAQIT